MPSRMPLGLAGSRFGVGEQYLRKYLGCWVGPDPHPSDDERRGVLRALNHLLQIPIIPGNPGGSAQGRCQTKGGHWGDGVHLCLITEERQGGLAALSHLQ